MPDSNTVLLLLIAVTNLITASLVLLAKRNIDKIELNTNSLKDALVASTAKASKAEGVEQGRAETAATPPAPRAPKPPLFGILGEKDRD